MVISPHLWGGGGHPRSKVGVASLIGFTLEWLPPALSKNPKNSQKPKKHKKNKKPKKPKNPKNPKNTK